MALLIIELSLVLVSGLTFWATLRRRNPLGVFRDGLLRMARERPYRGLFIWIIALPAADVLQTRFDPAITAWLGYDLTEWIHWAEGDWAAIFQRWQCPAADWLFTFAYIIVLPVLLAGPIVLAAAEGNLPRYRALSVGLMVNYLVGLPFYFLCPVREMWAGNPDKVVLLMDRVSPALMEAYRMNSALDNCFPSLHTSLAITAALIASRGERLAPVGGRRGIRALIWALAIAVVLSTLYLGIHWASDVAAGVVLAIGAASLAERITHRSTGRRSAIPSPATNPGARGGSFLSCGHGNPWTPDVPEGPGPGAAPGWETGR